ncbi:MAG: T9SS type A sorting domain-containing protein, partial [bacterium]|nr:T9SS type A sorting domain-containing protein [bacterium]
TVSGLLNHDSEPGFDHINFVFQTADGELNVAYLDGEGTQVNFSHTMNYDVADYVGENSDEVRFDIHFKSDGTYSDVDCLFSGGGACTVDDLHVVCSNGNYDYTEDFSNGMGDWVLAYPLGTGDFAQIWTGLEDIDPCRTNYSPQVAFIDDGTQVPGVGPSYCQNWCYGPGGYVVNYNGGAGIQTNPDAELHNAIESPVVAWPGENTNGAQLVFGVFRHEDLSLDSPGIYYTWSIRSGFSEEETLAAEWVSRDIFYYGGPEYTRTGDIISDLLTPGLSHIQVQLACVQILEVWGFPVIDGTPAPYFDNVRLTAFPVDGPAIATREIDLANDNWPEAGELNMDNLSSNNVRFDAATNKGDDIANIPGDSLVCEVVHLRSGGVLVENRLNYSMNRNPVFDSVRDPAWETNGFVDGQPVLDATGNPLEGKFSYDLPDSGFLFPGDILHYFFSATDEVNNADPQTNTLPKDISQFGQFNSPETYPACFQVHALPSIHSSGSQPPILFWNDSGEQAVQDKWLSSLHRSGFFQGDKIDIYFTNGADSGLGNGLGGRATPELLAGYETILYSSESRNQFTLSDGQVNGPGNDVGLLSNWLETNNGQLFATGDGLASDLATSGAACQNFLHTYLNLEFQSSYIHNLIQNQSNPLVITESGNSVFSPHMTWVAVGSCETVNSIDAVEAGSGAQRLARFASPDGVAAYSYSAATLNETEDYRVISFPYDFVSAFRDVSSPHPVPGVFSSSLLFSVLHYFGYSSNCPFSDLPEPEKFHVSNYPNPFNPSTKIQYNIPEPGHVSLKVYNLKGEWVRTLVDENREAGIGFSIWDGTDEQGAQVSSGIYFYEVRTAGEVIINKMALVK